MLIALPSIMHSGTHLLKSFILPGDNRKIVQMHFLRSITDKLEESFNEADWIVSPMRHPARILASFRSRGKPMNDEEQEQSIIKHYGHFDPPAFAGVRKNVMQEKSTYEGQWETLGYYMDKYKIDFIHVDDPAISNAYPVNSRTGSRHGNHNLKVTKEMENEIPDWIMDIYNETLTDVSYMELPSEALLG